MPTDIRHFLDIDHLTSRELRALLDNAHALKKAGRARPADLVPAGLSGATLAMIFERPSTRTRVSFDVAMRQLGGETIVLSHAELQLGRGETVADTARVLSRYVDAIMLRTGSHEALLELAHEASVPVINGLTNLSHPCQIVADIMTFEERLGPITGRKVAWIGDANNVAASWIHAAGRLDFELWVAAPEAYQPDAELMAWARAEGAEVIVTEDARAAAAGADCIIADTWVSMGDEDAEERLRLLAPFQVNGELMGLASSRAIFLHCLPAYRGKEVTADVLDGPQSAVFDEAENRLHGQKAILVYCLGDRR
ncbi:MAG: ornithine carbamoyltransferase [Rhizobiales bacterium]|nr:ornithine carbamoyltransferase [Hyphomicrobiales bacterium]